MPSASVTAGFGCASAAKRLAVKMPHMTASTPVVMTAIRNLPLLDWALTAIHGRDYAVAKQDHDERAMPHMSSPRLPWELSDIAGCFLSQEFFCSTLASSYRDICFLRRPDFATGSENNILRSNCGSRFDLAAPPRFVAAQLRASSAATGSIMRCAAWHSGRARACVAR